MVKKKRVYVVPHSHWDREWYFTIEDSNVLLVENLDHLIEVLENDPDYHAYVFDGQVSVVEEYLKIRPENRNRLANLIRDKRIFIGPWYTQTDSLLVDKESIIRNLLYGTEIAKKLGHSMEIGYLPDIFGQNAYLPSIFNGFDIAYSIVQRGIYTDQLNKDLNFTWTSPDGKSVMANNLYFGYGPGKFLEAGASYLKERLLPMLEKLAHLNLSTDHLLLPAGGDQVLVREHLPKTVRQLNEKDDQHEYFLSDYETFMRKTWNEGAVFSNEIKGELIASQNTRIHNTIRSQRYDIKKLNDTVEHKLIHILEPLTVIGKHVGLTYPRTWLDLMWKQLFDVHAHDSIGGCNSDDTNQAILHRLEKVNRITDGLLNIIKKQITEAVSRGINKENILVLFNTSSTIHSGLMEAAVFTKSQKFEIKTIEGHIVLFDIADQQYISGGKKVVVTAEGEKEVAIPGYYRSVIYIRAKEIPAMGYSTFIMEEGIGKPAFIEAVSVNKIENNDLLIEFQGGSLSVMHKPSGRKMSSFFRFENAADAGDSYDFSPLPEDRTIYLEKAELIKVESGRFTQKMVIKHEKDVPGNLQERKEMKKTKKLVIQTIFELREGEKFVRVKHEIANNIKDHRLRVLFTGTVDQPKMSFADQGFSILKRSISNSYMAKWRDLQFAEAPVPIYPLENFSGIIGNHHVFAVITKGLKEYEVLEDSNAFALTLFRSVGLLGRDDLCWRPGRASGINNKIVYTPDAQLQKHMQFEYALYFDNGSLNAAEIFAISDKYRGQYAAYQKQKLNSFEERLERFEIPLPLHTLPDQISVFGIGNKRIFMSCCKLAMEDDGIIIRMFNPGNQTEQVTIDHSFQKMSKTNLSERELAALTGTVKVAAKGYVTLKLI
ncbi:alpha-mannosidase [Bacillaceae bacterium Marseille-Q3522]|nr:alpha-mannosidase [Bacillaceae bacterium Marseille-Q3522]